MSQNSIYTKNSQIFTFWVTILLAFSVFAFFYRDSIKALFYIWNEYGTYSHGYLTVLLSVYLVYLCIKENRINYSKPSIISAICLVLTSIVWLVSYLSEINIVQMLCLPFFAFFTVIYFLGLNNYRVLMVPVLILLFVMPIWSVLLPFLQDFAIYMVNKMLLLTSLDYQSVDNEIILPLGIFEIEESCSGLRFLLVGVLLSVVYGFLNYKSYWAAIILVFSSVIIMLIANLVRILIIIAIGVEKGMDNPIVQDHASLGWVVFAIFLVPLFVLARYIDPILIFAVKEKRIVNDGGIFALPKMIIAVIFYLTVISAAPLYAQYAKNNIDKVAKIDKSLSMRGGWDRSDINISKWELNYFSYSHRYKAEYTRNENEVALSVYLYTKEISDSELINVNNVLVDQGKWEVINKSANQPVLLENKLTSFYVNKATIESEFFNECKRVWYWFEVDGKAHAKGWRVKLSEAFMVVKGKSGSVINTISTSCSDGSDQVLADFLVDNISQVKSLIVW